MGELTVTSISVEEMLNKLHSREWLIPQFQRDFVWSIPDVIAFAYSILSCRPIGMATIWAQPDNTALALDALSMPDKDENGEDTETKFCYTNIGNPLKIYAVLDGRQRCHAVAMAFGGFRPKDIKSKFAGRYFLDVTKTNPGERVKFLKEKDIRRLGYDREATCISNGLFPLSTSENEPILAQWMRYLQAIRNPANYSDGNLPDAKELDRRDSILKDSFDGIIKTRLAVYIVPESYQLGDICEIFETLNTTGTKVSTVDLVHSWLYADTKNSPEGEIRLREWIADFGQRDGAIGWAIPGERPELTVQMVTACYVALENKAKPRRFGAVGKGKKEDIFSIRADDMLATPTEHWRNIINNESHIAQFLGEFQRIVADGYFPYTDCPYPVTSTLYVALRFHWYFDAPETHEWGTEDLNALFKAFFWRNALNSRYDQGVPTKWADDVKMLKNWLKDRKRYNSSSQWASKVQKRLEEYIKQPTKEELVKWITNEERPEGALEKALMLPMKARAKKDILDENLIIGFPNSPQGVEMHHIYPKSWCQNNKIGALAIILDKDKAGKDWVNSIANLMPLSRKSNNLWKSRVPGQMLEEKGIKYTHSDAILRAAFINKQCFDYLRDGAKHIQEFWQTRANLIADDLSNRVKIIV